MGTIPPDSSGSVRSQRRINDLGALRRVGLLDGTLAGRSNTHPFPGGQVAQLVEQRTENPRVGGSIPPLATIQIGQLYEARLPRLRQCTFSASSHLRYFSGNIRPGRSSSKSTLAIQKRPRECAIWIELMPRVNG